MANTLQLIQWHQAGKLKPHIDNVYALADAPKALRDMMDRKVKGKVILAVG